MTPASPTGSKSWPGYCKVHPASLPPREAEGRLRLWKNRAEPHEEAIRNPLWRHRQRLSGVTEIMHPNVAREIAQQKAEAKAAPLNYN